MFNVSQIPADWQIGAICKADGEAYSATIFTMEKDCGTDLQVLLTPELGSTAGLLPNPVSFFAVPFNYEIGDPLP